MYVSFDLKEVMDWNNEINNLNNFIYEIFYN